MPTLAVAILLIGLAYVQVIVKPALVQITKAKAPLIPIAATSETPTSIVNH
jgi:hypothetical protein